MRDGEFLTDGIALTLVTKGGNVGIYQTEDHKMPEGIVYKKACFLKCI